MEDRSRLITVETLLSLKPNPKLVTIVKNKKASQLKNLTISPDNQVVSPNGMIDDEDDEAPGGWGAERRVDGSPASSVRTAQSQEPASLRHLFAELQR